MPNGKEEFARRATGNDPPWPPTNVKATSGTPVPITPKEMAVAFRIVEGAVAELHRSRGLPEPAALEGVDLTLRIVEAVVAEMLRRNTVEMSKKLRRPEP
jgi:hypothetical protein